MTAVDGHADATYMLDVTGPAAPPRSNGELVFATPWESRIFGVTMALYDAGHFPWEEFRSALIEAIGAWERQATGGEDWSYYRCWQQALEHVTSQRRLVGATDLTARTQQYANRPAGHDHHDHDTHDDH